MIKIDSYYEFINESMDYTPCDFTFINSNKDSGKIEHHYGFVTKKGNKYIVSFVKFLSGKYYEIIFAEKDTMNTKRMTGNMEIFVILSTILNIMKNDFFDRIKPLPRTLIFKGTKDDETDINKRNITYNKFFDKHLPLLFSEEYVEKYVDEDDPELFYLKFK